MIVTIVLLASLLLPLASASRVAVVAGTHGNEFTGVYVLEQLEPAALRRDYPSLRVETLIANPRAFSATRRFIDADLNRQFAGQRSEDTQQLEAVRAAEIEAQLGPKGSAQACDVVVDLHTTTSNMGCTLIVNSYCQLALRAAAYLTQAWAGGGGEGGGGEGGGGGGPDLPASVHPLRIYVHDTSQAAAPYLCSVGRAGLTIEVGPTPTGLLRADAVATTQSLLSASSSSLPRSLLGPSSPDHCRQRALGLVLRFLDLEASGRAPQPPPTVRVYVDAARVPWPAAEGGSRLPGALIAPGLQDRDFEPLAAGDALFVRRDGRVVEYDGESGAVVYPVFVNEAAYYHAQSGAAGVALATLADWPIEDVTPESR